MRVPDDLGRPQLDCRWLYITRLGALPRPRPTVDLDARLRSPPRRHAPGSPGSGARPDTAPRQPPKTAHLAKRGGGGELLSPLSCGRFGRWWSLCSGRRTVIRSRWTCCTKHRSPVGLQAGSTASTNPVNGVDREPASARRAGRTIACGDCRSGRADGAAVPAATGRPRAAAARGNPVPSSRHAGDGRRNPASAGRTAG